jgi:large subunit ribosomal protein L29
MHKEMKNREVVKELTTKEIQERMVAEKEHLVRLKLNHSISPLDNPMTIKETRKAIARFATELRQREINQK